MFCAKNDALDQVVRYKVGLVANDLSQVHGVDFHETFAPVAKFTTIKCIFAIRATMDLEIHHIDVKMTFLNDNLEEDIYIVQLEGFVQQGQEKLLSKLKMSL